MELTEKDLKQIADTYHLWRNPKGKYKDIEGFCKSASIEEVKANNYILMPGKYVGTEEEESDGILFEDKMLTLTNALAEQFAKRKELEKTIRKNLSSIGYEI
jgi:type I restriction enzyme M protein